MEKNNAVTQISGFYYGLLSFSTSILSGIISALFGILYQGSNSSNPVILTFGLSSIGIFYLISLISLSFLKIKI